MSIKLVEIIKGLLIKQDGVLNPAKVEILPGGTAGTKTTIQTAQTSNVTITLPNSSDTLATQTYVTSSSGVVNDLLDDHIADPSAAHAASAISTTSANVQTDLDTLSSNLSNTTSTANTALSIANAAIPKSIVDAKGDLLVASDTDTVTKLTVGSNGNILIADDTQPNGIKWGNVPVSAGVSTLNTLTGDVVLGSSSKMQVRTIANDVYADILTSPRDSHNYSIVTSVSGGQLVVTLKGKNGQDLSATNIATIGINDDQGNYTTVELTSNIVLTVPGDSYLGATINAPAFMWLYLSKTSTSYYLTASINYIKNYYTESITPLIAGSFSTQYPFSLYGNVPSSTLSSSKRVVGRLLFTKHSNTTWIAGDITNTYIGDETLLLTRRTPNVTFWTGPDTGTIYWVSPGVTKIKVKIAGGGGGGGPSGSTGWGTPGSGGFSQIVYDPNGLNSSFPVTIASVQGGLAGGGGATTGGSGGTSVTINSVYAKETAIVHGEKGGSTYSFAAAIKARGSDGGGCGGTYGSQGSWTAAPSSPQAGSGSGGAGAGYSHATVQGLAGTGGGGGAFAEFIMFNPVTSFKVIIGAGGTAGTAGTNGFNGAAGAAGFCIIEEYFD